MPPLLSCPDATIAFQVASIAPFLLLFSCLLSTVVLHNLYMSAPENRPDASKHGASDSIATDSVDWGRPSVVAHANYVKRVRARLSISGTPALKF
jgi:hypothetical protein